MSLLLPFILWYKVPTKTLDLTAKETAVVVVGTLVVAGDSEAVVQ